MSAAALDLMTVEVEGGPLVLASNREVDDLEANIGVRFPVGYREYVTVLGEGQLEALVRVYPPWRILNELDAHRGLMAGYWFWQDDPAFGQVAATESIPLGDTVDGDAILFHPDRALIVVLPRHEERLSIRGADLLETIEWLCAGGTGSIAGPGRTFVPYDSRPTDVPIEDGREGRLGVRPRNFDATPPALDGPARTVLLAYFAELAAVESWGRRTLVARTRSSGNGRLQWPSGRLTSSSPVRTRCTFATARRVSRRHWPGPASRSAAPRPTIPRRSRALTRSSLDRGGS